MAKTKTQYVCSECGHSEPKWLGKCPKCNNWQTFKEFSVGKEDNVNVERKKWVESKYSGFTKGKDISSEYVTEKIKTGIGEFDTAFGGGITIGSVNLISGEPGVGKSTLLTQVISLLSEKMNCGYISGEESLQQIRSRAKRIGYNDENVNYLSETNVEEIIGKIKESDVKMVIIDSIQTIYTETSKSAAGSTSQVKESTAMLTNFAKSSNITILIIGHVTKDGAIAGPKVLEHIVDGVFQIEGDQNSRYRIIRVYKNRFGQVNEIGVFAMTEKGMKEVSSPSAMFLSSSEKDAVGTSIIITKEGKRAIMYEIQSLVTDTDSEIPQRLFIGLNYQRAKMILAIMQKHLKTRTSKKDTYVSVVGGVQIQQEDTSADLSLMFSLYSSIQEKVIPKNIGSFGELSLTGEIRPVPFSEDRVKEAEKHGFKCVFIPKSKANKQLIKKFEKIQIIEVSNIKEAISKLKEIIS